MNALRDMELELAALLAVALYVAVALAWIGLRLERLERRVRRIELAFGGLAAAILRASRRSR